MYIQQHVQEIQKSAFPHVYFFFFKSHTFLRKETYVQHTAVMLLWLKQKHKHFSNKDSARKPYMN